MALIFHIQASELAFENGNRKFLISEILDFPDKRKKRLIFDGVFQPSRWHFLAFWVYVIPLMIFLELSKTVSKTFLAQ